jgi:hypothetical protein
MNTYFSLFFWAVFIAAIFSPPDPMLEDSIIPFCATNELLEKQLNDDLDLPKKLNEFEVKWQSHLQQNGFEWDDSVEKSMQYN